jgi:hypothetical protein
MDKKRNIKNLPQEDIKGFEEFIEGQPEDDHFLPRGNASAKKEVSFEHFTFLTNDSQRLHKLKDVLMHKIPFASRFEQGQYLVNQQENELQVLRKHIYEQSQKTDSPFRKSLGEIFNNFFEPPRP